MDQRLVFICLVNVLIALAQSKSYSSLSEEDHQKPAEDSTKVECSGFVSKKDFSHVPKQIKKLFDWENYQRIFRKHYSSATEQATRLMLFLGRVARAAGSLFAFQSNCSNFYLTVNKFSDRIEGELRQLYAQKVDEEQFPGEPVVVETRFKRATSGGFMEGFGCWLSNVNKGMKCDRKRIQKLNDKPVVDWTTSPDRCLQAPGDQGECGCCYAMAFVKLYEWLHCRQQNNRQIKFSEQYLVDCGHLSGLKGCISGSSKNVLSFIEKFGLLPASRYRPFSALAQTCPVDTTLGDSTPTGIDKLAVKPHKTEHKLLRNGIKEWELALDQQPLVIFLRAEEDFLDYGGGVYDSTRCDQNFGHFMLIVGHGIDNGQPYWLLSNSFGSDWGLNGYVKLSKTHEKCIAFVLKVTAEFGQ